MAGGMNDMVATIRQLKDGIKTARCGGKLIFQLWKIDMRLDDVPDDNNLTLVHLSRDSKPALFLFFIFSKSFPITGISSEWSVRL